MSFIIRETTSGNVSRPAKVSASKEKQDIPPNVRELDKAAVAPGRVNKKRSNTDELLSCFLAKCVGKFIVCDLFKSKCIHVCGDTILMYC